MKLALAIVSLAAAGFLGCAQHSVSTTTTAADVPSAGTAEEHHHGSAIPPAPASDETPTAQAPAGDLVCRTKSRIDGTSELYLQWSGENANGILRKLAPSGMVYEQRVRAERTSGLVVVDDSNESDLVTHAAIVRQDGSKKLMRVGDANQAWTTCE